MTNSTDQDQAPTYRDDVYRGMHYENTPIQIYRTFHLEKKIKNFRIKNSDFLIFLLKT